MKNLLGFVTILTILTACATSPTGRKQLVLLPESQLGAMGAQSFDQLKSQTPIEKDAKMNAYVRCVAEPLTAASKGMPNSPQQWEIVVFKDNTPNAFALPGGKIGVHTGLLPVAKTDAQLAAVVGHEIGHVIAQHGNERVSQNMGTQLALTGLGELAKGSMGSSSQLLMAGLGLGAQVGVLLPFSRTQESEADIIGLDLMTKAGFDPAQSVELWKNMAAAGGGSPPEFLSTHPSSSTRIDNLGSSIPKYKPQYDQAVAAGKTPKCQR